MIGRTLKTRTPLERILPEWFVNRHREFLLARYLVMNKERAGSYNSYYRSMSEATRRAGETGHFNGTPWEENIERVRRQFKEWGIDPRGRKLLDISGSPGHLVKTLSGVLERGVVTECYEEGADAMRRYLGLEAYKFDFNKDRVDSVMSGKFDIVAIRYTLNFCRDVPGFLADLKNLLAPAALVYVEEVASHGQVCLRFQLNEYPYPVLYTPAVFRAFFEQAGFTCRDSVVGPGITGKIDADDFINSVEVRSRVARSIIRYYVRKANRRNRILLDRELLPSCSYLFQLSSP